MSTQTLTLIESGCCGAYYAVHGTDASPQARCVECGEERDIVFDILPYMEEGEALVTERHPSGVSILGYVTAGE